MLKSHSSQWNSSHDEFRGHDPENLDCHLRSIVLWLPANGTVSFSIQEVL